MVKKYQLKNGLTVLLAESKKSPVLSVQYWVRTGAADERPAEAGISHFLEHLVFKGTTKYGVGEIASLVEGSGGELNAYTSFDQTVFHVTIDNQQSQVALDVICEMMGRPLLDKEEVDKEREVVVEEIKRGMDSPQRRLSQQLFSKTFKSHPYSRPVIGYEKVVRGVPVKTLKRYHDERYSPRNAFLVVSGDFDQKTMKGQIEQTFGAIPDKKIRKVVRPKLKKSTGFSTTIEVGPFPDASVSMAWRVPSAKHKDLIGLEALAMILGQGESSRLVKSLRIDQPIVHGVGSGVLALQDAGLFIINFSAPRAQITEALSIVHNELNLMRVQGPKQEELDKAAANLASEPLYSFETVDGLARSFGGAEFSFGDPEAFKKLLEEMKKLDLAQIRKLAQKYLVPDNLTIAGLIEKKDEKINAAVKQFAKKEAASLKMKTKMPTLKTKPVKLPKWKGLKTREAEPDQVVKLPGGGLLLLRKQDETPTVSMRVLMGGGLRVEPKGQDGLLELTTRTWTGGTKSFNETEMNDEIDATASSLGAFSGRNSIGLSADFITSADERMWKLIHETLTVPTMPEAVFERERRALLQQIPLKADSAFSVCYKMFSQSLFGDHPYAKDSTGTEESLTSLQAGSAEKLWKSLAKRGNLVAAVVGDINPSVWKKRFEDLSKEWEAGDSELKTVPHQGNKKEIRLEKHMAKQQQHLIVGYHGLGLHDGRRWALHLMQAILAGQGGRLFLELRDKNSLAYSVSPLRFDGLGTGLFGVHIGCSPEKTEKAEAMIKEELMKLASTEVSEDELNRARINLVGRTAIELQRKSAIANILAIDSIYGLDPAESLDPAGMYQTVKPSDIRSLAQELFKQPAIVSSVGPAVAK